MEEALSWTCPYCDRDSTLREGDYRSHDADLKCDNADGYRRLSSLFVVCPNPQCRKVTLTATLFEIQPSQQHWFINNELKHWRLIPPSKAKTYPAYVPQVIIDDYNEACLICDLSPKASATLSRRCLQGILRDFWDVKPGRLINEIHEIEDKTDPLTWEAIDSVRKIGNIGAHMEKDINLIVDVEPDEAILLIELIESLIRDWYIHRHEREDRLRKIKGVADDKDQAKK